MNKKQLITPITIQELKRKCEKFNWQEGRGVYYDWAVDLYNKGYKLHAMILLLSTWNFAYFRYAVTSKDFLPSFEKVLKISEPIFEKLKKEEFQKTNLNIIGDNIKEIYAILSKVKGIKYVGASKIMHLINRRLFVMWDNAIKKAYGIRTSMPEDYLNFLKLMQVKFKDVNWTEGKPLTKAIDEYNYASFTLNSNE